MFGTALAGDWPKTGNKALGITKGHSPSMQIFHLVWLHKKCLRRSDGNPKKLKQHNPYHAAHQHHSTTSPAPWSPCHSWGQPTCAWTRHGAGQPQNPLNFLGVPWDDFRWCFKCQLVDMIGNWRRTCTTNGPSEGKYTWHNCASAALLRKQRFYLLKRTCATTLPNWCGGLGHDLQLYVL